SPQKIAEWRNIWFSNDDTITPFTPEEIENMTFSRLSQDESTVTFSDQVIDAGTALRRPQPPQSQLPKSRSHRLIAILQKIAVPQI
ncbi:MAG: hypothetical protein ACO4AJ_15150, partial [Prochlorothrix sp.]